MLADSVPYQWARQYQGRRPPISHTASTPAGLSSRRSEESTATSAVLPVRNAKDVKRKPLPSRPANYVQQQHIAYSKSYDASLPQSVAPHTEIIPLPDETAEVLSTTRPPLASKFSFDNLAAMSDGAESGGPFKRMVTNAWLQNISQAARSSIISASNITNRASPPSRTTSSKGAGSGLVIGNPEPVHPALNGSSSPNTALGRGARRVGLVAEAFRMPDHRIYMPPSSPSPRRSEDSIRSVQSSTSIAISFGSGCTMSTGQSNLSNSNSPSRASSSFGSARAVKHDRDLPYLPLRLKSAEEEYMPSIETSLSPTDTVEQLLLTPRLPENVKDTYKSPYSTTKPKGADVSPEVRPSRCELNVQIAGGEIPFGHPANSRPPSPLLANTTPGHGLDQVSPPLSPPIACTPPLNPVLNFKQGTEHLTRRTARPYPMPAKTNQQEMTQAPRNTGGAQTPFHAMLLQPVPTFPASLSDEEKLINLHVGGSNVYTTRLSAITSHPHSRLAVFLEDRLRSLEESDSCFPGEVAISETTPHNAPERARSTKLALTNEARLSDKYQEPGTVVLNFPNSPIHALRSARASIYDDISQCEGDENTIDNQASCGSDNGKKFRNDLQVPAPFLPNPRKTRLRFSRGRSGDESDSSSGSPDISARSSDYTSSTGDDHSLGNFLDTTPDSEDKDPFILQEDQASSLQPADRSQLKHQGRTGAAEGLSSTESADIRHSNSSSSCVPSLSSSSDSSSYQADSPILSSGAAKQLIGGITAATSAFETLITKHERYVLHPVNIYLDRSAGPYDAILHFLGAGTLPRKLCLNEAELTSFSNGDGQGEGSIQSLLDQLPSDVKRKLLPLVFHPILSEIRDVKEEAAYLGFSALVDLCEAEISKLDKMTRWSRNMVAHPGLHTRSESEGGPVMRLALQSSPRLLGKQANRPRPRLVGHRQFNSESKVIPRPVPGAHNQANWI